MNDAKRGVEGAVKADFSQVPVPPEGVAGEPATIAEASGRAGPERASEDVAELTFLEPATMSTTIAFNHPFVWEGVEYHGVRARRLSYAEVARVYERAKDAEGEVKLIEFYAEMTGLPAPVIRGMESGDAKAVIEGCYPFLPRQLRSETSP